MDQLGPVDGASESFDPMTLLHPYNGCNELYGSIGYMINDYDPQMAKK